MYQLQTSFQQFGDSKYLDHNLTGQTVTDDRRLFAQRVPSIGIFNFGQINGNASKTISLADYQITSPIQLVSIYALGSENLNSETIYELVSGETVLFSLKLLKESMPFAFPNGAVVDPSLSIRVKPKSNVSQVLIYWQPVHVLSYIEI